MQRIENKFNNFLFSPVNPKVIIIFRVLVAAMIAFMFAPRDINPIPPLTNFPELIPYIFSPGYYILIYGLIALFALGVRSRLVALSLFLVLVPHDFQSEGIRSKQVILAVLFCFIFIKSLPIWQLTKEEFEESDYGPIWPVRLIQFQLSFLYGINAIAKTSYHYLSGEALSNMSVVLDQFQIDMADGFLDLGFVLVPVYLAAIGSAITEYWLAIGFWFKKTRWFTAFVGIGFHLTLTFILSIFMLDYTSIFLYMSFLLPFTKKVNDAYSSTSLKALS